MRVLQVFGHLNFCGAESRMMDVYRSLDRNETVFDFLSQTREEGDFEPEIKALGGKVIKITPPRQCGIFTHIKELREVFRQGNYDAVHAHTLHQCGIILLAAYLEKVKVRVAHARNSNTSHTGFKNALQVQIGKILIKLFATDRIAVSKLAGDFLFGKSPFKVIPNAIDVNKYIDVPEDKIQSVREEFNLSPGTKVIGHIGRFEPMKNHKFIIDWFEDFSKSHPDFSLMLVGEGSLFDEIKNNVKERGLDSRVIFAGKRGDVPVLLKVFDVLILPSLFEGLPGVVLEAEASGIHSVVADTVTKEADMDMGRVHYLPLDKPEKWGDLVRDLAQKPRAEKDTIISAFDKKGFTVRSTAEKYTEIYKGK